MIRKGYLFQTGGGRLDWHPLDGEPIEGIINRDGAPTNSLIRATFDGNILTHAERVGPQAEYQYPTRKHVALMHLVRDESEITPELHAKIRQMALEIQTWQRARVQGKWDIRIEGFVVVHAGSWNLPGFNGNAPELRAQVQAQIAERNLDFDPNYTHGYGGSLGGYAGLAYMGTLHFGRTAAIGSRGTLTIDHELSHQYGQGHSDGYQDPLCALAHASRHGWNMCKRLAFGLVNQEHQKWVDQSDYALIAPMELWAEDMRPGEVQAVMVRGDDNFVYVLSKKKPKTQHIQGTYESGDEVHVHCYDPAWRMFGTESNRQHKFRAGSTITLGGVTMEYLDNFEGVARLAITRPGHALPTKPDFPQLTLTPGVPIDLSHNALWADPMYGLQGIELYVLDDPTSAQPPVNGYWFTHTTEGPVEGSSIRPQSDGQAWFYLQGEYENGNVRVDIFRPLGNGLGIELCGRGILRLDDDGELEWRYWLPDYGRDHLTLKMLAKRAPHPFNGLWQTSRWEGFTFGEYVPLKENGEIDERAEPQLLLYRYAHNDKEPVWHMISNGAVFHPQARYQAYQDEFELGESVGRAVFDGTEFLFLGNLFEADKVF